MESTVVHIGIGTKSSTLRKKGQFSIDQLLAGLNYRLAKIKISDKVILFRLMATMVNAGITIVQATDILAEQIDNLRMRKILANTKQRLERGEKLSDAFAVHSAIFSEAEIGMIRAGESSGKLNIIFVQLAEQVEKSAAIQRKVKSAMIYPSAVLIMLVLAFYGVMLKIVPTIKDMFSQFNTKLPALTEALIATGDFMNSSTMGVPNALLSFVMILGAITLVQMWRKSKFGKPVWDTFVLKIPIFGSLIQKSILASLTRTLALLVSSGVSIVEALKISAGAIDNAPYKKRVLAVANDLNIGISIGDSLRDDPSFFPPMVANMMAVGEKTAQLAPIANKVADFYEEEVDTMVDGLSKIMEPIIIVVVGGFVAFLVGAIMMPIMSLSDIAGGGA